jgi:hypothetical protein
MSIADALRPPMPIRPCYRCGGTDYWWREKGYGEGAWVCSSCHPNPNK